MYDLGDLPGGERVARGLRELAQGASTLDGLLVSIASRRLSGLGLELPAEWIRRDPELALYAAYCATSDDPYGAYGAALRELDSFVSALEARQRLRQPKGPPFQVPREKRESGVK